MTRGAILLQKRDVSEEVEAEVFTAHFQCQIVAAIACGFNRSTQHRRQIALPVSQSLTSLGVAR